MTKKSKHLVEIKGEKYDGTIEIIARGEEEINKLFTQTFEFAFLDYQEEAKKK